MLDEYEVPVDYSGWLSRRYERFDVDVARNNGYVYGCYVQWRRERASSRCSRYLLPPPLGKYDEYTSRHVTDRAEDGAQGPYWMTCPWGWKLRMQRDPRHGALLSYSSFVHWALDPNGRKGFYGRYMLTWDDDLLRTIQSFALRSGVSCIDEQYLRDPRDLAAYWTPHRRQWLHLSTRDALAQLGISKIIGTDWLDKIQMDERKTLLSIPDLEGKIQYHIGLAISLYFRRVWN